MLAVLCFHADLGWAAGGFLGVSIFFTLSGFLITNLLLAEHERSGTIALRAFYERRVRRLVPAALVVVGLVVAAGAWWASSQRDHLPGDVITSLLDVANWRFATASRSYFDLFTSMPSPLAHFWSLAIEEQCYLVLPVVAAWALRRGRRWFLAVLLVLAVGSLVATLATTDRNLVYNGTHTRAGELLVGAIAAVLVSRRRPSSLAHALLAWGGVASLLLLLASATLRTGVLYRGGLFVVAIAAACTVVGLTGSHAPVRWLRWRWLVAVGRVSYGVYLFHWPVYLLLNEHRLAIGAYPLLAVRLVVTAGLALCSYRLIEQPIRSGAAFARGVYLVGAWSASVAMLVVAALLAIPAPVYDATQQLLREGTSGTLAFPEGSSATGSPSPGSTTKPLEVMVVGSVPAVADRLRSDGLTVVDQTDASCPVVPGVEQRLATGEVLDTRRCVPLLDRLSTVLDSFVKQSVGSRAVVLTLGPLDAGVVRREGDVGFPDTADVSELAARMDFAQSGLSDLLARLNSIGVPLVLFDAVPVSNAIGTGLSDLALAMRDGMTVHHHLRDLPSAVRAAASPSSAVRVLVVGDSTSLDLAKSLDLAADGSVDVLWAGANGCPLVRAVQVRPSADVPWSSTDCVPFDRKLPPIIQSFHPDAVVVSVGPTELQEQRYAQDDASHVAGDTVFEAFHDREIVDFLRVVGDRPVVFTDTLAPIPGGWASKEMAEPERVAAWNRQVLRWAGAGPRTRLWRLAAAIAADERQHGNMRPDGVHPEVAQLADLLRGSQLAVLRSLIGEQSPGGSTKVP